MDHLKRMLANFNPQTMILNGEERSKWVVAWQQIHAQLQEHSLELDSEVVGLIRDSSYNQQIIAEAMLAFDRVETDTVKQLQESLSSIHLIGEDIDLGVRNNGSAGKRRNDGPDDCDFRCGDDPAFHFPHSTPADEADGHLRDWFLAHLAYPFPDKPTKSHLSVATGLDVRQLNTWFTNMRRRSGWTEYLRSYAGGNKQRFAKMCTNALKGDGDEKLAVVLEGVRKHVGKSPRGKVGDWLLNIIEEGTTEEQRASKKPRLERPAKRTKDIRHTLPEYTLAPPRAPEDKPEETTPIDEPEEQDEPTSALPENPADDSTSTPAKALEPKNVKSRKDKTYDFSIGASDDPKTPSRRRPTASCRPSPLRTVSTASSSSLQAVDQVLRSVSGSSSTISSNVSSDLNFSFPVYSLTTSPLSTLNAPVPPMSYTNLLSFGTQETYGYGFNPGLPQSLPMPFYPTVSYAPSALYPPIQLAQAPTYTYSHQPAQQPFQAYPVSEMRFTENFGVMKRGIEDVAGVGEGRMWKVPRMGGV